MLEALLTAVLLVAYFAALAFCTLRAFEQERWTSPGAVGALILIVGGLTVMALAAQQENEKGPCLEYRNEMQWNPATKTMMPARYCVNRGEWVKP